MQPLSHHVKESLIDMTIYSKLELFFKPSLFGIDSTNKIWKNSPLDRSLSDGNPSPSYGLTLNDKA